MTGYESKRAAAQDKLVTDIDGHVVRHARKSKKGALDRDAEIERLNEKIEFLARTNMLYSDWEHRDTQVTSDLIRKGIEEAKINTELRAEIVELKTQLAQPAQEPVSYDKTEMNGFVQDLYDKKMQEGKHGHYETMFHVVHQAIKRATPPQRPWVMQREWVDLTDEEIDKWAHELHGVIYAVMAELKEKNNG